MITVDHPVVVRPSNTSTFMKLTTLLLIAVACLVGALLKYPVIAILIVPIVLAMVYLLALSKNARVEVSETSVTFMGAFGKKQVLLSDIYKVAKVKKFWIPNGTGIETHQAVVFIGTDGQLPGLVWSGQYTKQSLDDLFLAFSPEAKVEFDAARTASLKIWFLEQKESQHATK